MKKKMRIVHEDDFDNIYELLGDEKYLDEYLVDPNVIQCSREIDKLIQQFAKELKKLSKKYKHLGIGDTATDEAIAAEIYRSLH